MLCDAIAAALRQDSWHVDVAHDGRAAQTALIDHGYAAVLLDLGLPGNSGLDVLSGMRARYDATPALASIDVELSYRPTARLTLTAGPGLTWSDEEYMQTFFGISDEQAARSDLAPYAPEAGVSVVRVSLGAQYQFSGQWFAGLRVTAAQLKGDATDSPIVQDKNQNLYALFVGYRF
ncbi:hypothetical protein GCM10011488_15500 [Steroidobacter agaridevorans]|nr:hypothetical protein GCM10011488_15500 [Steroidobacter agaridevorans]